MKHTYLSESHRLISEECQRAVAEMAKHPLSFEEKKRQVEENHKNSLLQDVKIDKVATKRVKVSTIVKNIKSGKYDVTVFYTNSHVFHAWVVKRVEGEEALSLALQLLNEWGASDGKVEKMKKPYTKLFLDKELWEYRNLYTNSMHTNLFSDKPAYISLDKKSRFPKEMLETFVSLLMDNNILEEE